MSNFLLVIPEDVIKGCSKADKLVVTGEFDNWRHSDYVLQYDGSTQNYRVQIPRRKGQRSTMFKVVINDKKWVTLNYLTLSQTSQVTPIIFSTLRTMRPLLREDYDDEQNTSAQHVESDKITAKTQHEEEEEQDPGESEESSSEDDYEDQDDDDYVDTATAKRKSRKRKPKSASNTSSKRQKKKPTSAQKSAVSHAPAYHRSKKDQDQYLEIAKDFQPTELFDILSTSEDVSIEELLREWLETYSENRDKFLQEFINLLLNCCGSVARVEDHDVHSNESSNETIGEIQLLFQRQKLHEFYLLISKENKKRKNF
ncbi:AVN_HP_G0119790.mRNA.1.CDS.1 [Saccharomyces cerevisiae]|nr:AVN_HP_G0119790.mRNA.1.CDS.1 [Saccharomyces cerevisiae]CAI6996908.1 AVN_HP_G0119790.mRNA.1.CDS.1 [Saccharomyces cerevisiae]